MRGGKAGESGTYQLAVLSQLISHCSQQTEAGRLFVQFM